MTSSIRQATPVSRELRTLKLPVLLWRRLILDLRSRGRGERESGAFILGTRNGLIDHAMRHIPYDDLDPQAIESGIIRFESSGYSKLWEICRTQKLRVVADVHSHPTGWVGQSNSDQTHPMIPESGHLAIIVPHFARTRWWSLTGVGLYEYLGGHKWETLTGEGRARIVIW